MSRSHEYKKLSDKAERIGFKNLNKKEKNRLTDIERDYESSTNGQSHEGFVRDHFEVRDQ